MTGLVKLRQEWFNFQKPDDLKTRRAEAPPVRTKAERHTCGYCGKSDDGTMKTCAGCNQVYEGTARNIAKSRRSS